MYEIKNQKNHPFSKWEKIQYIQPSGYVRKGTLQVFHKIKRQYPNDYIVCIGYDRGETQFALTETFKKYETTPDQVIDRCLYEECSVERTNGHKPDVFVFHERHATIFCVPLRVTADSLKPCDNPLDFESEEIINQDDDKTRKLVLLVHGDLPTLQTIFGRFQSAEKDITHLMVISCQEIRKVFPTFFPSVSQLRLTPFTPTPVY